MMGRSNSCDDSRRVRHGQGIVHDHQGGEGGEEGGC